MKKLGILFLLLVIRDCDATPSFKAAEVDALQRSLQSVKENQNIGISLGRLTCVDNDASGALKMTLESGEKYIQLKPTNYYFADVFILNNDAIDYELAVDQAFQNDKVITIRCLNVLTNIPGLFEGKMVISDVNDNPPTFARTNVTYQVAIDEIINSTLPKLIYNSIQVSDRDGVDNNIVSAECLRMESGPSVMNCTGYFSVTAVQTGNGLYTFNVYALRNSYSGYKDFNLIIRAKNVPLSATEPTLYSTIQNMLILINDIQNLPPNIDKDKLSFEMYENASVNTLIGHIDAYDQDVGDPNAIMFQLIPASETFGTNVFRLGQTLPPQTGYKAYSVEFILNNTIDREAITDPAKTVYINIMAIEYDLQNRSNRNPMNASDTISVQILDINDMAPMFNMAVYNINIPELGTSIANPENFRQISNNVDIEVQDLDSALYNSFSITVINGNGNFKLDKTSGSFKEGFTLYAKEKIMDYELPQKNYTIMLKATDTDRPVLSSNATVNIYIIDINDHSPEFPPQYTFFVPENAANNTYIGTIHANDSDSGVFGQISQYFIYDISNTFWIDKQGNIYLIGSLDYETRTVYSFVAKARDGGALNNYLEGTTIITILVTNVNDEGPQFLNNYTALLYEESLALIPPIVIQAVSRDANFTDITYSIVSVVPSSVPMSTFSVNATTGNVKINYPINYQDTDSGTVLVTLKATSGIQFATTVAAINVVDINNFSPEFKPVVANNTYSARISEIATAGTVVIVLNATDADGANTTNGQVTFQIQRGANDDFVIQADSGAIMVSGNANLDVDVQNTYEIIVLAVDKGNPVKSALATVIVHLDDANNKSPVFLEPLYRFQMNQSDPINTPVGTIVAKDPDQSSRIEYSIDFSTAKFYKSGSLISSNVGASKIIKIEPSSGIIQVAGDIDRTLYDRIDMYAIAEDKAVNLSIQARQTASTSVVIFILATVDARIYFDPPWTRSNIVIQKSIPETNNTNYTIIILKATDPVVPETVKNYTKLPGSDPENYFDVQSRFVIMKKALDYESLSGDSMRKVSVVVLAISSDGLRSASAIIEVIVQDLNDNAPVFEATNYTFFVPEDKLYPFQIGTLTATDADSSSYGQVQYTLFGSRSNDFQIYNQTSGTVSYAVLIVAENRSLDFETTPEYQIQVMAQDNPNGDTNVRLQSTANVIIVVEDINDNAPVFEQQSYTYSLIGTQDIGGDVGIIRAIDLDAGKNGEVTYTILSADNSGSKYFAIENQDQTSARVDHVIKVGRIYVRQSLEALPDRSQFILSISARDFGQPFKEGFCTVKIIISKGVQDNKPKWDESMQSRIYIPENINVSTFVYKATAYPADFGSAISYSFSGAGDAALDYKSFSIDNSTGIIRVALPLDYETKKIYNLQILATDTVNTTLTNQFLLVVAVQDIDDNHPSFLTCPDKTYPIPVYTSVLEDEPAGMLVYKVIACDLDSYPYNLIDYTWANITLCDSTNQNDFRLNSSTGEIFTNASLDREFKDQYSLCVKASPHVLATGGRKKRSIINQIDNNTEMYIVVDVLDVNDMKPNFTVPFVKTVITQYPPVIVSIAEAKDLDLPPNNILHYSIKRIDFVIGGKKLAAPTAFSINTNDGTIIIGTNDYTDYMGGYFDITVVAADDGGFNDTQIQRVYVTDKAFQIRVVFNRAASAGVEADAQAMIKELNAIQSDVYYEIKAITYHVIANDQAAFDRTDVCLVVVSRDLALSSLSATMKLNEDSSVQNVLNKYGAVEPGPCEPAMSVYPQGWQSYWWVLVAFAIFIFVCCLILIFLDVVLYRQYRHYMDTRQTYLVPEKK